MISDDIVATMLLSIRVGTLRKGISGWAPQHLLRISQLAGAVRDELQQVPSGVNLHELSESDALELVGWESEHSPAYRLFQLLRQNLGVKPGPGRVAVYKLLARKRPKLLAVRDTVVERAVGHQSPHTWWMPWWHSLTSISGLVERLEEIRTQLPSQVRPSILRTADIVLWMNARS